MAKSVTEKQFVQLEIGKTTKSEVLNLIGLPHQTERQAAQGGGQVHRWIYLNNPDLSVMFGGVLAGHLASDHRSGDRKDIVAIIEFSEDGIVTDFLMPGGES